MQKRSGISPVIATVIIVAVTIAVAIAVAFWMTGIVGLFTGFEQLQITSIYDNSSGIVITVQNTGTSTATITDIYVNGLPSSATGLTVQVGNKPVSFPIPLNPGNQTTLILQFSKKPSQFTVTPGVSLEIKLHTASGKDYPKLIVLQAYSVKS
ncbi:archaellin/type IV pilin N-terminal domain-containing protein [Thermofilum sp.]|uniref:archaellin/type IV pilin N-terminal domain-containing protein n=1 Tax=Thermofilum sp. TaxID=1961369 RepID=UPI0031642F43